MKKLSLYIFLGLLWCNVGFAEIKDKYVCIGQGEFLAGIDAKITIILKKKLSFVSLEEIGNKNNQQKPLGNFLISVAHDFEGIEQEPSNYHAKILNNALDWFSLTQYPDREINMNTLYLNNKYQSEDRIGYLDYVSWKISEKQYKKLATIDDEYEKEGLKKEGSTKHIEHGNNFFNNALEAVLNLGYNETVISGHSEYICND